MSRENKNKVLYFEYTIYKLIEWVKKNNPSLTHPESSFTKLKALKLLFFVAAVNSSNKSHILLDIFNNFYAMPYGPVESDIYNSILHKLTKYYNILDIGTQIKSNAERSVFYGLDNNVKKEIDKNIELLLEKNPKIIELPPYKLVDISHKWSVWINSMSIANILGKKSEHMTINEIIASSKFYE